MMAANAQAIGLGIGLAFGSTDVQRALKKLANGD